MMRIEELYVPVQDLRGRAMKGKPAIGEAWVFDVGDVIEGAIAEAALRTGDRLLSVAFDAIMASGGLGDLALLSGTEVLAISSAQTGKLWSSVVHVNRVLELAEGAKPIVRVEGRYGAAKHNFRGVIVRRARPA